MKIEKIFIKNIGPFEEEAIDFCDDWTGKVASRALISGPNGCGKTTLLNCISYLWKALGFWLYEKKELPKNSAVKKYFGKKGAGCALLIDGVPDFSNKETKAQKKILIYITDTEHRKSFGRFDDIEYEIGEINNSLLQNGKYGYNLWINGTPLSGGSEIDEDVDDVSEFLSPGTVEDDEETEGVEKVEANFFYNWSKEYRRLILSGGKAGTPNLIYLDAEERRWVRAEKKIGRPVQENMSKRWLYKYEASKSWESQLEASLITLKTTFPQKFHDTRI